MTAATVMPGSDLPPWLASAGSPTGSSAQRAAGGDGDDRAQGLPEFVFLVDFGEPAEDQSHEAWRASGISTATTVEEDGQEDGLAPAPGLATPAFFVLESFPARLVASAVPAGNQSLEAATTKAGLEITHNFPGDSSFRAMPSLEGITRDLVLPAPEAASHASCSQQLDTEIPVGMTVVAEPQAEPQVPVQGGDFASPGSFPSRLAGESPGKNESAALSGAETDPSPGPARSLPDEVTTGTRPLVRPNPIVSDGSQQSREAPAPVGREGPEVDYGPALESRDRDEAPLAGNPASARPHSALRLRRVEASDRNLLVDAEAPLGSLATSRPGRVTEPTSEVAAGSAGKGENRNPGTEAADSAGAQSGGASPRGEIEPPWSGWIPGAGAESHAATDRPATQRADRTEGTFPVEQLADGITEQPPRRLFLQVEGEEGRRVDIRVLQASGHLSVRLSSLEADLNHRLRAEIRQLEQTLRTSGWRAEVGVTETEPAGVAGQTPGAGMDSGNDPGSRGNSHETFDSRSGADSSGRGSDRKGAELKEEFRDLSAIRRLRKGGSRSS